MQVDLKLLQRAEKEARDTGNNPLVVYERLLLSGYSERGKLLQELIDMRHKYNYLCNEGDYEGALKSIGITLKVAEKAERELEG